MIRLAPFLALLPTQALAQVCALERPDWRPENGPATSLDELAFLFTSLPGLGILGALMLAALTGQRRYFAISAVFATLVGAALTVQDSRPDSLTIAAIAEGCVGPQTLPIAACVIIAAISAASLAWLWLRDRPGARI